MPSRESPMIRFWRYVHPTLDDSCWLWQGALGSQGYGQIGVGLRRLRTRRNVSAHRVAYEIAYGTVLPFGIEIDHLCRVRRCVNPRHLEAVTHIENTMRGMSPMAKQARQTECKYGHALDTANTWRSPTASDRKCRKCGTKWRVMLTRVQRKERRLGDVRLLTVQVGEGSG